MTSKIAYAAALAAALAVTPAMAQNSTGGSAGTATTPGGMSASTVGVGATSDGNAALGMGASGAAANEDARVRTSARVNGNNNLNGQAKADVRDGGEFARSHTRCKAGDDVSCTTRTMAHVPGSKPVKSTSSTGQ